MVRPLMRIAILLVISVMLLLWIASPAAAEQRRQGVVTQNAVVNSGKGMNRQGSPSVHPGKGWKDPGQVQGSSKNLADPDCTGNRTVGPQPTNIGACDNPAGAADKPNGPGGFDSDKDWNNGCGNDADFEDDNNGRCGGRKTSAPMSGKPAPLRGKAEVKPPRGKAEVKPPRGKAEVKPPRGKAEVKPPAGLVITAGLPVPLGRPAIVFAERIRQRSIPVPAGRSLPATGLDSMDLLLVGVAFIAIGRRMLLRSRLRGR